MRRRPPRSTRLTHSFPTRRSSDLGHQCLAQPVAQRHAQHADVQEGQSVPGADHGAVADLGCAGRSEEHTSELQSLMRISYAVFCLKKKKKISYSHIQTQ